MENLENMIAIKKLMPGSLLNFRFRGTTLKYEELLIALEPIIIDKVSTTPTTRQKKVDTSAPMEIGIAAKDDSESSRGGDQRIMDIALPAVQKGTGKRYAGGKDANRGGKNSWQESNGKKRHRKVAMETARHAGHVVKQDTLQPRVQKEETRPCMSWEERTVKSVKKQLTTRKTCKRGAR